MNGNNTVLISRTAAKNVLALTFRSRSTVSPRRIVRRLKLDIIKNKIDLTEITKKVIFDHNAELSAYRAGKKILAKFFVGQVMKYTNGRADPRLVNKLVEYLLNEPG